MPFKTTVNWLFHDMWCYLVIAFFVWKIGVFQQTAVKVSCILNSLQKWSSSLFKIGALDTKSMFLEMKAQSSWF